VVFVEQSVGVIPLKRRTVLFCKGCVARLRTERNPGGVADGEPPAGKSVAGEGEDDT